MTSKTIVLIHGLWLTPRGWEHWIERYQEAGFTVHAPSWPGLEVEVEALRKDSSPLAGLSAKAVIDHYDTFIRALPESPIIMGHSFGGGFTQVLLDRGLGAAGVAIDSAPPKGILTIPLTTLRSGAAVLRNPLNRNRAVPFSRKQFAYAFGNTMSDVEIDAAYERYAIPAAGRVFFDGGLANLTPNSPFSVTRDRADRAPLLITAGEFDHVVPPQYSRANLKLYEKSPATVELKEFAGRSHFLCGEKGWEEVADTVLDWAVAQTS